MVVQARPERRLVGDGLEDSHRRWRKHSLLLTEDERGWGSTRGRGREEVADDAGEELSGGDVVGEVAAEEWGRNAEEEADMSVVGGR